MTSRSQAGCTDDAGRRPLACVVPALCPGTPAGVPQANLICRLVSLQLCNLNAPRAFTHPLYHPDRGHGRITPQTTQRAGRTQLLTALDTAQTVATPPEEVAPATACHTNLPGTGRTILVSDDEEDLLDIVVTVLEGQGYTVVATCDGESALEAMQREPASVDLMLLDVAMPRLGGPAVVRQVRQTRPLLPCILMTGHCADLVATGLLPDPALRILRKPFPLSSLLATVRELVG